jgi:mRNA interferase RelE/StbE
LYKLDLSAKALDFYNKLHSHDRSNFSRIDAALDSLKINPFRGKPLKHSLKGSFSLRVGMYRIIYTIEQKTITVHVFKIGHRRDVYN